MRRLTALILVMATSLLSISFAASAQGAVATDDDMVMGNPKAKVTVIEYASASCSHCAAFNNDVFPAFKAKYIDTGKVKYVFREVLTAPEQLAAAGFILARCTGKDKYFNTLDGVFHSQAEIYRTRDMRKPLLAVAQSAGLTEDQFIACLSDQEALKALNDRVERIAKAGDFDSTPTFFINGKKLTGEHSLTDLDAAIDIARADLKKAAASKK